MLPIPSGERPGMLPNTVQCTRQPPRTKNYPAQEVNSVKVEKLRSPITLTSYTLPQFPSGTTGGESRGPEREPLPAASCDELPRQWEGHSPRNPWCGFWTSHGHTVGKCSMGAPLVLTQEQVMKPQPAHSPPPLASPTTLRTDRVAFDKCVQWKPPSSRDVLPACHRPS